MATVPLPYETAEAWWSTGWLKLVCTYCAGGDCPEPTLLAG
jgi:hypothetical protein